MPELFQAYYDCRRNKRTTRAQLAFEQRMERNLARLCRRLNDRSYEIGPTRAFVITHPKYREVWAGQFPDRVVHHVMYNRIFERFARGFIFDTYACIPGRGVMFGANRVHRMMRQATENWQRPAYVIQADLANFFVSIDKAALKALALPRIPKPDTAWLTQMIIDHDPTVDPKLRSSAELFARVPRHKSLFNAPDGKGLPIGNLSSQYFANVYLDPIDQYAKRELGIRWYARYVDDIVLIGHSMRELNEQFAALRDFAERRLHLRFHPNKTRRGRVHDGINFCGRILKPFRQYLRRSTAQSMFEAAMDQEADPQLWHDRVNSYLGQARHANTYRLRRSLARRCGAAFGPRFVKLAPLENQPCT